MATPKWAPGKLYPPGSLVIPRTGQGGGTLPELTNPGFETGDASGWALGAGMTVSDNNHYTGNYCVRCEGSGEQTLIHESAPAAPGMKVTANCYYKQGGADAGDNPGAVIIRWLDSGMNQIGADVKGTVVSSGSGGAWHQSAITAQGPAGTEHVQIGGWTNRTDSQFSAFDTFSWSSGGGPPAGLVFRAVQDETGYSDSTEPEWPAAAGIQVVDHEVVWEGVLASRVVWEASPILLSGATEPEWVAEPGAAVADNTITWVAVTRSVDDPKCPQSPFVVIGASKVFAGDTDITAYSGTVNPLDWHKEQDAGYLPTGLQQYGSNPCTGLALYRSNLVVFNAEAFQLWQIDEDPQSMALLDAVPIGSVYHHALCPVANDLLLLSSEGVRSIGIAAGSTNLQAGDVGMPVDSIVQEALAECVAAGFYPIALYYPAAGQYWLIFNTDGEAQVFVLTKNQASQSGAWTRYEFPYEIHDWCIKGNALYLRSGDDIYRMDEEAIGDQLAADAEPTPFPGVVWWPYLDLGSPGITKMVTGFDIVSVGQPQVQLGYNQNNPAAFTAPLAVPADSVPGMILPIQASAPSFAPRLTYDGTVRWHFRALNLYLADNRMGT